MSACMKGHVEAARLLLEKGAAVDAQREDGVTALMLACQNGHVEAARLLLEKGAAVDANMEDGFTALMLACQGGHVEAARLLLEKGAAVDAKKEDGATALMLACLGGHVEAMRLLLEEGAAVDRRTRTARRRSWSPANGRLASGAAAARDLEERSGSSASLAQLGPLKAALDGAQDARLRGERRSSSRRAWLLLEKGAAVDAPSPTSGPQEEGSTSRRRSGGAPVDIARGREGSVEAARLLLEKGADRTLPTRCCSRQSDVDVARLTPDVDAPSLAAVASLEEPSV